MTTDKARRLQVRGVAGSPVIGRSWERGFRLFEVFDPKLRQALDECLDLDRVAEHGITNPVLFQAEGPNAFRQVRRREADGRETTLGGKSLAECSAINRNLPWTEIFEGIAVDLTEMGLGAFREFQLHEEARRHREKLPALRRF